MNTLKGFPMTNVILVYFDVNTPKRTGSYFLHTINMNKTVFIRIYCQPQSMRVKIEFVTNTRK